MSYVDTFINVAADGPAATGIVPTARGDHPSVAQIEYQLLSMHPYRFTQDDPILETCVRHRRIGQNEIEEQGGAIRAGLFKKGHPCLRASSLTKRSGWGAHHDGQGRIAL